MKNYKPFDLRKANNPNHTHSQVKMSLHQPYKKLQYDISKSFMSQDEVNLTELTTIFNDSYNAPEVYTAWVKDVLVSPKAWGLPRYHAMFFDEYYLYNTMGEDAKRSFEKSGYLSRHGDVITLNHHNIKDVITISGLTVWLYTFKNSDHLFRECLPAFVTLKELGYDIAKLKYVTPVIDDSILALLNCLGVPSGNIIQIENQWIKFEELLIPCFGTLGHLHTPTDYYLKYARYNLACIEEKFGIKEGFKRIYVSRKNAKMRRVLNESVLEAGLRDRGFTMIDPGDYSKIEQIQIFANAEIVIGPHGMGIANFIFSKNPKLLLEIFQENLNKVSYYRTAQLLSCRYAGYYVKPLTLEYCLDSDKFGDVLGRVPNLNKPKRALF